MSLRPAKGDTVIVLLSIRGRLSLSAPSTYLYNNTYTVTSYDRPSTILQTSVGFLNFIWGHNELGIAG